MIAPLEGSPSKTLITLKIAKQHSGIWILLGYYDFVKIFMVQQRS